MPSDRFYTRVSTRSAGLLRFTGKLNIPVYRLTGGRAYFPRFQAELPEIFHDVIGDIRNQYNLAYHPTNPKLDGTYRKLKVEVVAPDGGQLKVKDQKGKDVKYNVVAREGYTAKHTVE